MNALGEFRIHARETCGPAGENGHGGGLARDRRPVNPGDSELHRRVVHQVPGLEVVGAVENYAEAADEFFDVAAVSVGDDAFDFDIGIDALELPFGGHGLGKIFRRVRLIEEHLPLEVRRLDVVPVDNPQSADARARQGIGLGGPERAASDDHNLRAQELSLPLGSDGLKEDLAGVFFEVHDGSSQQSAISHQHALFC